MDRNTRSAGRLTAGLLTCFFVLRTIEKRVTTELSVVRLTVDGRVELGADFFTSVMLQYPWPLLVYPYLDFQLQRASCSSPV